MPLALVMSSVEIATTSSSSSSGARLVGTGGRELPLLGTSLRAEAGGGIARTVVEQRFRNPHAEALAVTYSLPLPADGAVSGFAFTIGQRRIAGEVQGRAAAREEYERALYEGRSAALLEQDRSSLFTQEIGNIPPGETIVAEITVDQPLRWLDEGSWEWRFPTVVAPRYLGEPGRVADAERVAQDVADGPLAARFTLACTVCDALAEGRSPESPSHAMTVERDRGARSGYRENAADRALRGTSVAGAEGATTPLTLRIDQGARLDRDVVVRWPVVTPRVGLSLSTGRPAEHQTLGNSAFGLLTIVPPGKVEEGQSVQRDLIVLLDTSGSMDGEPLAQARRVVGALIGTLGANDSLEMIEFSSKARRWQSKPVPVMARTRAEAFAWLRNLRAGGSTEMRTGILEALAGVRPGAQRQVIVVTDGQIGFETEVIRAICDKLPPSSRLHMVGVGSAVNRSLTGPAARAGRGIEVILGLGEDPERAAARLVARTDAPIVVDMAISGDAVVEHAPQRLPDLFKGAPALVSLALRPSGGELLVRGKTAHGTWEQRITVPQIAASTGSQAVVALFGRESIEDCETAIAAGRDRRALDGDIERLGLAHQLATRLTSWIAVTREITVDPTGGLRHERMPQELPHGMSAEGVGLRAEAPSGGVLFSLAALVEEEVARSMPASKAGLATPATRGKIDLKARLGKAPGNIPTMPVAGPASSSVPSPAFAPPPAPTRISVSAPMRDVGKVESIEAAPRRKANIFGWTPLVFLVALAIAYYFTRSIGLAVAIASVAFVVTLSLRGLVRALLRK